MRLVMMRYRKGATLMVARDTRALSALNHPCVPNPVHRV
jgi:hypothetical protein